MNDNARIAVGITVFFLFIVLLLAFVTTGNDELVKFREAKLLCGELLSSNYGYKDCKTYVLENTNITKHGIISDLEMDKVVVLTSCYNFISEHEDKFKYEININDCVKYLDENPGITNLDLIKAFKQVEKQMTDDKLNTPVLKNTNVGELYI